MDAFSATCRMKSRTRLSLFQGPVEGTGRAGEGRAESSALIQLQYDKNINKIGGVVALAEALWLFVYIF